MESRAEIPGVVVCTPLTYVRGLGEIKYGLIAADLTLEKELQTTMKLCDMCGIFNN